MKIYKIRYFPDKTQVQGLIDANVRVIKLIDITDEPDADFVSSPTILISFYIHLSVYPQSTDMQTSLQC